MYSSGHSSPYQAVNVTDAVRKTAREEVEKLQKERESCQSRFIKVFRVRPSSAKHPAGAWYATFDYEDLREVDQKIQERFGGGAWRVETWIDGKKKDCYEVTTEGEARDRNGALITAEEKAPPQFESSINGRAMSYGGGINNAYDPFTVLNEQNMALISRIDHREKELSDKNDHIAQLSRQVTELTIRSEALQAEKIRIEENARRREELIRLEMKFANNGSSETRHLTNTLLELAFKNHQQQSPVEMVGQMREILGLASDLREDQGPASLETVLSSLGPILGGLKDYFQRPHAPVSHVKSPALPVQEPKEVPVGFWTTERFTALLNEGLTYQPDPEAWSRSAYQEITSEGRRFLASQEGSEGLDLFADKIPHLDTQKLIRVLNDQQFESAKLWLVMAIAQLKRRCLSVAA